MNMMASRTDMIRRIAGRGDLRASVGVFSVKIAGAVLAICVNLVVTRSLPIDDAGRFFSALSTVTILYAVGRLGFGYTTSKYVALAEALHDVPRQRGAVLVSVETVLLASIVTYLAMAVVDQWVVKGAAAAEQRHVLLVMGLALPFFCVGSMFLEGLKGLHRAVPFSMLDSIVTKALNVVFVFVAARAFGLIGAAWGYVTSVLIGSIAAYVVLGRFLPAPLARSQASTDRRPMYASASLLAIVSVMTVVGQWAGPVIVSYILSARDAAIYFTAYRTSALLEFVVLSASAVIGPSLVRTYTRGSRVEVRHEALRVAGGVALAVTGFALPLLVLARVLMGLYGPAFADHAGILRILALGQWLAAPTGIALYVMIATGHERLVALSSSISTPIGLAMMGIAARRYGLEGAAGGQALFLILQNGLFAFFAYMAVMRGAATDAKRADERAGAAGGGEAVP